MEYVQLHDRDQIEGYLQSNPDLHVYGLGDLEDEFWPHTEWYGAVNGNNLAAICFVFSQFDPPTVVAISEAENTALYGLMSAISDRLPDYFGAHLGISATGSLSRQFEAPVMSDWRKMALTDRSRLAEVDVSKVERLGREDQTALRSLYDGVYRHSEISNVFDPSMLDVGPYFGVREGKEIVSVAGVHVFSPRYGVAAVANVATHPGWRNRGLASAVTARLCQELDLQVQHVGLNVAKANDSAVRAYRRIGFETIAGFGAGYMRRRA